MILRMRVFSVAAVAKVDRLCLIFTINCLKLLVSLLISCRLHEVDLTQK